MFKGMRNRIWLNRIAQQELFLRLAYLDDRALGRLLHEFERDLKAEGLWPCDSPEELAIHFGAWFDKRPESGMAAAVIEEAKRAPKPWTPWQWHAVTSVAPGIVTRLFLRANVPIERVAQDPWMVCYVFGFLNPWLDTMPNEIIETAGPELARGYFDAVFGSAEGGRALSFALNCLKEDSDLALLGKDCGNVDSAVVIKCNPNLNAIGEVPAERFWAHMRPPNHA